MRQHWLASLMAMAVLPALGVAVLASGANAAPRSRPASSTITSEVTLYGWNDNSPPGCETAYSGCAGGQGTFAKPTTFATDKAELAVGTLVYVAHLKRYFVMGDDCVACDSNWKNSKKRHIDLWAGGSKGDNATKLENCEDKWTVSSAPVIVSPASGETVANGGAGGAVYKNGTCWNGS